MKTIRMLALSAAAFVLLFASGAKAQEKFASDVFRRERRRLRSRGDGPRQCQCRHRLCRSPELRVHVQSVLRPADRLRVLRDHGRPRPEGFGHPACGLPQARRSDRLRRAVRSRRRRRLFLQGDGRTTSRRKQHGFRGSRSRRRQLHLREVPGRCGGAVYLAQGLRHRGFYHRRLPGHGDRSACGSDLRLQSSCRRRPSGDCQRQHDPEEKQKWLHGKDRRSKRRRSKTRN